MKPSNAVQSQIEDTQLVPVHISWDEVLYFNYLQELVTGHQQDEDKKTGLRAYPGLSMAIRIPEIREIFMAVVEMQGKGESLGKDINAITKQEDAKIRARGIPSIDSDSEQDIHLLDETGEGNDKVLVMMPLDVVHFLDILQGGEKKDPILKLQEFGLFGGIGRIFSSGPVSSIIRTVATVGGAVLGGPLGAAAGNFAGRLATGQNYKKAILPSLPNALYAYGAGHALNSAGLGSYAGAAAPGSSAAWGSSLLPEGKAAVTTSGTSTAAAGNGAAGIAGKEASSTDFGKLLKEYGPGLALMGGGLYLGNKKDKRDQKNYEEDKERYDRSNREATNHWNENGLREPLLTREETPHHIRKGSGIKFYKKGGKVLLKPDALIGKPIRGKGKGQDDVIFIDAPEKTWIHNATFVGDAGDGSSDAGQKEIEKLEKFAAKNLLTPEIKKKFKQEIMAKPLRMVPCALSDHERGSSALTVTALGHGSNDTGNEILRDMVKEMRRHKISRGDKLPPPAPDLIHLYKKVAHKHLGGQV